MGPEGVLKLRERERGIAEEIEKGSRLQAEVVANVNTGDHVCGSIQDATRIRKSASNTKFYFILKK